MRVAWVVPGSLEQRTGGYIYDAIIVRGLRAKGDAVHVLGLDEPDANRQDIQQRIDGTGADVVVGDALAARELAAAFPGVTPATKRVLLVHHFTSWEHERPTGEAAPASAKAEATAVAASDAVIATSAWTARRIAAEHGRVASVVVPGADRLGHADALRGKVASEVDTSRRLALLFVGSVLPRKRLPLLLDAIDQLAHPRLELRLAGDPSRDAEHGRAIEARIARSPYLRAHVVRLGLVDDAHLAGELARASALVLPSSLEGYGMVLTEALHAGVPVIAARTSAIPEVVGEGSDALLFDEGAGLLEGLRRFATDGPLRVRMRLAARARAAQLPTWDGAVSAFRSALGDAVTGANRAPPLAPDR